MKYLTTDTLIASVKRRASIPANQQTFQEEDFLAFANEELDIGIVPHVLSFHEEYFVYTELVPLESNVSRYQIPARAVGNRLRELAYQDQSGNVFEMSRVTVEDYPSYQNNVVQSSFTLFYVEGTDIVLVPETGGSPVGYLRFSYYLRPNELVPQNQVAMITNISRQTGEISVNSIPEDMDVADVLDLVQTGSPHKTLALDITATAFNTSTNTITFDPTDIPASLVVGDHIALAQQTIVPQVPSDLHSMLAQRIAARCLESLGDNQGLEAANAKLGEMEQKTGSLIDNRVEGAPLKIVNKHSILKRNKLYWRY